MTASSPVTADDLVNGLKFNDSNSGVWNIVDRGSGFYYLVLGDDTLNSVQISANGLTITFGSVSEGPTFTGFTFNE